MRAHDRLTEGAEAARLVGREPLHLGDVGAGHERLVAAAGEHDWRARTRRRKALAPPRAADWLVALSRAFNASGRATVTTATAPSRVTSTAMMDPPCGWVGARSETLPHSHPIDGHPWPSSGTRSLQSRLSSCTASAPCGGLAAGHTPRKGPMAINARQAFLVVVAICITACSARRLRRLDRRHGGLSVDGHGPLARSHLRLGLPSRRGGRRAEALLRSRRGRRLRSSDVAAHPVVVAARRSHDGHRRHT